MRITLLLVVEAMLAVTIMAERSPAAEPQAIGKPQPGGPMIVQVIGCLEQAADGAWILNKATEAVASETPGTSEASIKEAGAKALGKQRFRLIGTSLFAPDTRKGNKVEVKGVLIKDAKESRVNVTSLQTADTTCK